MSKSETQHNQTIGRVATDQTPNLRATDVALSTAGRAIRDLVDIETRDEQALPPTYEERSQLVRIGYGATARACNREVQG